MNTPTPRSAKEWLRRNRLVITTTAVVTVVATVKVINLMNSTGLPAAKRVMDKVIDDMVEIGPIQTDADGRKFFAVFQN